MTCIEVIIFILLSIAIVFFLTFAIRLVIEMIQSLKDDFILPLVSKQKSTKIIIKQGEKSRKHSPNRTDQKCT